METHNARRFSLYSVAQVVPDKPQFKTKHGQTVATIILMYYAVITFMQPIVSVTWARDTNIYGYNCSSIEVNDKNLSLGEVLTDYCPDPKNDDCDYVPSGSDLWKESYTGELGATCADSNLNLVPDVMFYTGILLAGVTAQSLPSDFGPRRTMLMTVILGCLFSFAQLLAQEIATLALFRFFNGFLYFVMIEAGATYISDITPLEKISLVFPTYTSMHGLALILHVWLSYGMPNWRHTCIFIAANFTLMIPILYFLLPESKIWRDKENLELKEPESMAKRIGNAARRLSLSANNTGVPNQSYNDTEETKDELPGVRISQGSGGQSRRASFSGRSRRGSLFDEFKGSRRESSSGRRGSVAQRASIAVKQSHLAMTFATLCKSKCLLQITIFLGIMWSASLCTFIGTTLFVPYLPKLTLFQSGSVMGVTMILGIFFGCFLSHSVSRKTLSIIFFFVGGGALLASGLLMFYLPDQIVAIYILAVIGKFFSAAVYPLCTLLSSDYYPAVCRETGVAFCVMLSRLFLIAVPFVIEAARTSLQNPEYPVIASSMVWLPQVVFGAMFIFSALVALFLPTLNAAHVMMASVEDAERYYSDKMCC